MEHRGNIWVLEEFDFEKIIKDKTTGRKLWVWHTKQIMAERKTVRK